MKKRIISILLLSCMVLSLFAGCGKKEEKESAHIGKKAKLTVALPQNGVVTDYDNNALTKYIEEKANVELEFALFSSASNEFEQQLTLMSVSNEELPDVIVGYTTLSQQSVYNFGRNGVLIDLTDLMKDATNYNAQYKKLSKEAQKQIDSCIKDPVDDQIYGMPLFVDFAGIDEMIPEMHINKTWLDEVGMSAPTNIDELYKVLKAFKEKDPNGNNEADEIPMLGSGIINYIISAFVNYNPSTVYSVENGKVYDPTLTNEYREALKYINKLVKEGLLSDLNFTVTSNQEYISLITPANDVAKVGLWCGHPGLTTSTSSTILDQYTALAPLADATGKGGYLAMKDKTCVISALVTKDCKDPEAAIRLIDAFYEDEAVTRLRHGEKDVDWKYGQGTNMNGNKAYIETINYVVDVTKSWCTSVCGIWTEENYLAIVKEQEGVHGERDRLLVEGSEVVKKASQPKEKLTNMRYTQDEHDAISEKKYDTTSYMSETVTKFMMGDLDPNNDAQWNEYLSEMKRLGSEDVLKVVQKVYDRSK